MRVKRGTASRARHKKILKAAKGFKGRRNNVYKVAKNAVHHALQYAYRDRRNKKRVMRRLWIVRINAAARHYGMSYSALMHGLTLAGSTLDRKALASLAVSDPQSFAAVAEQARAAISAA
jgi:large subunit ribosomal protein L20